MKYNELKQIRKSRGFEQPVIFYAGSKCWSSPSPKKLPKPPDVWIKKYQSIFPSFPVLVPHQNKNDLEKLLN